MTVKVVPLSVGAGIQRDGTLFAAPTYVDGKWVRFQYGKPRKIGGYTASFLLSNGVSRGMTMMPVDSINYVISGYNNGLDQYTIDNVVAVGSGPAAYSMSSYFIPNNNNLWQFDVGYDSGGSGALTLIAHPGQNLNDITSATNTRPLIGSFTGTSLTALGIFTASGTLTSGSPLVTFATQNISMGAGVTVTGTGIPANTTIKSSNLQTYGTIGVVALASVGSGYTNGTYTGVALVGALSGTLAQATVVVTSGSVSSVTITNGGSNYLYGDSVTIGTLGGTGSGFKGTISALATITSNLWTVTLTNNATASGAQTLTFDNNLSVSGGVVMLYPYLFIYGNNGLIQNCAAGNFTNWTSGDANANNVSATKVVQGLPLRGGTTVPSGLFWTLDSVVKVSYQPQNVGTSTLYWRYDLITQQSSILSSQCVIEYDGIYYWVGTDRFLVYNGVEQEIPNNQNFNYFFDNLNYQQRQKVWASKVPRFGEIWWFFPNGSSTECNDAIIYNVREKVWYDSGQALGARRSAGVFSEIFRRPIWASWESDNASLVLTNVRITGTAGQISFNSQVGLLDSQPINAFGIYASGAHGTISGFVQGTATDPYTPNYYILVPSSLTTGTLYNIDGSAVVTTTGTMTNITFSYNSTKYSLWQHETNSNSIYLNKVDAIESFFETNVLGIGAGTVGALPSGDNLWTRCERIEPDFVQTGAMSVTVTGKGYADDMDNESNPYIFDPDTLKIDMKEQRREMRLRFTSNVQNGDYFLGKVLLSLETGDVRGTGNP